MLVLVTGATGSLGYRVVQSLCDAGYGVRTLSLDSPPSVKMPEDIDMRIGDVTHAQTVSTAMQNIDFVIHLAALLHIVNPSTSIQEEYERINVGGTEVVIDAAVKAGVKRFILASTIAVYGPSGGKILNEDSNAHPDTFYAKTKLAAEKIVLNARSAEGQSLGTILRYGAVYGSRIKGNYRRLTRALARHLFIPIGSGLNRRTLVYDKDFGRAAVLAVSHPAAADKVFNVTDGCSHTLNEIIESICLALGRKPPRLSLPAGPTRKVIGLIEKGSYAIGFKPPVTRDIIDKYTEDIEVDGSLIQKELSFIPQYDLKTGWEETIGEMRARGEL